MSEMIVQERDAATASEDESRRVMEFCNACRYCEGFCAVFPAMTRRRVFAEADLAYLANVCHGCNACYHACQYAPPHEFAINVPQTLALTRGESYSACAWPRSLARVFDRNGLAVSLTIAVSLALVLVLLLTLQDHARVFATHVGAGAFYEVIGHGVMVAVGGGTFGFAVVAILVGMRRFAASIALSGPTPAELKAALSDIATLRYLGGHTDEGCNDIDESFSNQRRIYHQLTMWGFLLCFASTCVATIYDYGFGWIAPYSLTSIPVLLGTVGGVMLSVGCVGLFAVKLKTDPAPKARAVQGMDYAFIVLLFAVAISGLALLAVRETGAMGMVLAVHLGFVLAFFITLPYGKFVHSGYRFLALLKHAQEQRSTQV